MVLIFQILVWLSILIPLVTFVVIVVTLPLQIINIVHGGEAVKMESPPKKEEVVMLWPVEKE